MVTIAWEKCVTRFHLHHHKHNHHYHHYLVRLLFSTTDNLGCIAPLGMAFGTISDAQISASSQLDDNHSAAQARLHFEADGSKSGAWSALKNDLSQWLQVDLGVYTRVTRVATQGRNAYNEWVTKYRVQYSDDGVSFHMYRKAGEKSETVS